MNLVGEHAAWHIEHDAPLTSDIEGIARPMSHWVHTSDSADTVARDGQAAVAAAGGLPGRIATLILPANVAWENADPARPISKNEANGDSLPGIELPEPVDVKTVESISTALKSGDSVALVLGGAALRSEALVSAARIARATGAALFCETFKTRMERGAGRIAVRDIPYRLEDAVALLEPYEHIVTIGAKPPVAFFAYPGTRSELFPETAVVHSLAGQHQDVDLALQWLEEAVEATAIDPELQAPSVPAPCSNGTLTPASLANVVARLLPEDAIVVDESITAGRDLFAATQGSARHDWLEVCGGSIGGGFPLATGAAVAAPDRPVINFEGDGSGMYTVQALWTQARESLNVTSIVLANQGYDILKFELENVQAQSGDTALSMMELDRPAIDWVSLARGMGVPGCRVDTVAEFEHALQQALVTPGPFLIEARL